MKPRLAVFGMIAGGFALMEAGVWLYNRMVARELWDKTTNEETPDGASTVSE